MAVCAHADGPDCGWEHHYDQLNLSQQRCVMNYERRVFSEEKLSTITTSRTPARPDANMPAVCFYPIPCDWRNAERDSSLEYYTEWKASVTGTVSNSAKVTLGENLLRVLG